MRAPAFVGLADVFKLYGEHERARSRRRRRPRQPAADFDAYLADEAMRAQMALALGIKAEALLDLSPRFLEVVADETVTTDDRLLASFNAAAFSPAEFR